MVPIIYDPIPGNVESSICVLSNCVTPKLLKGKQNAFRIIIHPVFYLTKHGIHSNNMPFSNLDIKYISKNDFITLNSGFLITDDYSIHKQGPHIWGYRKRK